MTDTLPRSGRAGRPGDREVRVWLERDARAVESLLAEDRAYAAYALGHLEFGVFGRSEFWRGEGPDGAALVMHATALGPTTVVQGDPATVAAVVSLHPGPRFSYLSTAGPEHLDALRRAYHVRDALHMIRMSLTAATFQPVGAEMRRLHGRDTNRINALYAAEGGPSHYSAEAIERAVYYGAFEGSRLVAVAGTHVVAPNQSIAVVGNVLTHRAYRGLGLATRVTSAVTQELLERGCGEVTLTVDPHNTPAVRAYTRLGYRPGAPVVEARLRRRDHIGLRAALRRSAARRRARERGVQAEIVDAR